MFISNWNSNYTVQLHGSSAQVNKMATTSKVKIYSTPTCFYCKKAKEFLKENKIEYEEFNVAEDESAREEMIEKSGQMGVPVIMIGNRIIIGFDKEELKAALDLK